MTEKMTQLEAENADMKDKYMRKYAELENYKKRVLREREEAAKYSNAMLLLDILSTIDNFERAINPLRMETTSETSIPASRLSKSSWCHS